MPPTDTEVTDVEDELVDEESTEEGGGVSEETPEQQQPNDVEALRAEYEQKLQVAQQDLNRMKSSLQKQVSQTDAQWAEKFNQLNKQFRDVQMQGMDENQRAEYEKNLQSEEMQNLARQMQEVQAAREELARTMDAQQFFLNIGVPANRLVINEGYDTLTNSGWDFIKEELNELAELRKGNAQPKTPAKPRKKAPDVVTDKAAPSKGTTWKELKAKYGSEENVYQLVEQGLLSPDILPKPA